MSEYILELKDIVKTFGGVTALNKVQFHLKKGEVHALMGENGAGKSTLIKTITGVHQPDSGEIIFDGQPVKFQSSRDSMKVGIAAVYQQATQFPTMSVTENIFMGEEITNKIGLYNWKAMRKRAKEILAPFNDQIDVNARMSALSVAEQQTVEIAKALARDLKILILDEPTSSLTQYECEELYRTVRRISEQGVAVIFISHRIEDIYSVAETVTVFRDATYIGTWPVEGMTQHDLVKYMVGRELTAMYPERNVEIGDVALEIKNLSRTGWCKDVSINVRKGEVVALTGLVGAGRTEFMECLCGIVPASSGEIYLYGQKIDIKNPRDSFKHKIGLLSEDRRHCGLFENLPIYQNVSAATLDKFVKGLQMQVSAEKKAAEELCARVSLKAESISAPPSSLSGGNQQKVVFGKIMNCDLDVLVLDEPTKGVDVGAKYQIYEIMNELAAQGIAVIMVSSEMAEVLGMADRIYVMCDGRITGELDRSEATQEILLEKALPQKKGATA